MSLQIAQPQSDEHVFLIGRPPIEEYLGFLVVSANGQNLDRRALMDEWRSANDHLNKQGVWGYGRNEPITTVASR